MSNVDYANDEIMDAYANGYQPFVKAYTSDGEVRIIPATKPKQGDGLAGVIPLSTTEQSAIYPLRADELGFDVDNVA